MMQRLGAAEDSAADYTLIQRDFFGGDAPVSCHAVILININP